MASADMLPRKRNGFRVASFEAMPHFSCMRCAVLFCLLALTPAVWAAETVSIAAASNLVYALDALNAEFTKSFPAIRLTLATGASGNLVAQIKNGAPYDVFLSADL